MADILTVGKGPTARKSGTQSHWPYSLVEGDGGRAAQQTREKDMIFSVYNNISALRAHGTKMGVSANNIANVETEEFKKSRAVMEEGPKGSVEVEIDRVDTPGPIVSQYEDDQYVQKEMSNVDLAEEIPQTIPTQRGYEANLTVIKTKDEMLGSLIDIIG
jgi:flagellar basal-body rod protein FlgC